MGRTGFIPTHWAGKRIKFRIPYTLPGEQQVSSGESGITFPDGTFTHAVDKPFEIWGARIRLTELDNIGNPLNPQVGDPDRVIRLQFDALSFNQRMNKTASLVDLLRDSVAGSKGDWEWYVPFTIERAEGFLIEIDALPFTNLAGVDTIRVEVAFWGYLLQLEPASETR